MFSVIIPLYNKGPYLQRALDSVYAQGASVGEILVVNDGSTDGGERVARAQRDPRVRVLDQLNKGVGAARNAGIGAATGPYLAFLDADDLWQPGYLRRVLEMIEGCPGASLYGTGFATVADGRVLRRYGVRPRELKQGGSGIRSGENERPAFGPVDFFKEWARGHIIHTSSTVVPREAALAVGGFPEGVTHGEDLEFWAKLALAGTVVLSPEALTHYDVGVPGQAVEFWSGAYTRDFEVLPYHRFLACELGRCRVNTETRRHGERNKSFEKYCRRELRIAILQRLYRGRFDAAKVFCDELKVASLRKGFLLGLCCRVVEDRLCRAAVVLAMRLMRAVRTIAGKVPRDTK